MTYLSPEWRQKLVAAGFPEEALILGVSEEILRRLSKDIEINVDFTVLNMPIAKPFRIAHRSANDAGEIVRVATFEENSYANVLAAYYCYLAKNNLLPPQ